MAAQPSGTVSWITAVMQRIPRAASRVPRPWTKSAGSNLGQARRMGGDPRALLRVISDP